MSKLAELLPDGWEIRAGHVHRNGDGTADVTNVVRASRPRAEGQRLVNTAGWLLGLLAAGVLPVSYVGQFAYIDAARHQIIASNIEAGMFDVGMVIFALLGLGLAFARKPSRAERVAVMVCSFGAAGMNYAAADVASPRSAAVYVAPPLFLALCVDRVIAVVRRHRVGDDEGSPWAPLGRAAVTAVRLAGVAALYGLRLALEPAVTAKGLRRIVLNAAPLPAGSVKVPEARFRPPGTGSGRAKLITLYQAHPDHGDPAKITPVARELGPQAGLAWKTARNYLRIYLKAAA